MRSDVERSGSSVRSLHLFCDVFLGSLGGFGAVWHRWSRTVSWWKFPPVSLGTSNRWLYVLAVLAPLSSPGWTVCLSRGLSHGAEFNQVGAFGPWLVWGVPVLLSFLGYLLVEVASIRYCRERGVPADPSDAEKSEYVNAVLECNYRHNDGFGTLYRFKTPYLMFLVAVVGFALFTVSVVCLLSASNTVGLFVFLEVCFAMLVFVCFFIVCSMLPHLVVLLRLERLYGRPVEAENLESSVDDGHSQEEDFQEGWLGDSGEEFDVFVDSDIDEAVKKN